MGRIVINRFWVFACAVLVAGQALAVDRKVYPDENRAPLGADAQERVVEMEANKFNRPQFRMPDVKYRPSWEQLRNHPVPKWL
ncbi:hypothetical protein KAR91_40105, partial [Candidatus Pacearchaeota archaeon]|nr:hypothetical protein [Candidatus Pacearchaeota archaeon]